MALKPKRSKQVGDPQEVGRQLLLNLLKSSRLYLSSSNYKGLLEFVTRLRNFAPFNAMLLQIQKPGLQWAASENDWLKRFNRSVMESSRPLLILWPFGPVAFVYDVSDTEGSPLPSDVMQPFLAHGPITEELFDGFLQRLAKKGIEPIQLNFGSGLAGEI